jgi:hypothetical protein
MHRCWCSTSTRAWWTSRCRPCRAPIAWYVRTSPHTKDTARTHIDKPTQGRKRARRRMQTHLVTDRRTRGGRHWARRSRLRCTRTATTCRASLSGPTSAVLRTAATCACAPCSLATWSSSYVATRRATAAPAAAAAGRAPVILAPPRRSRSHRPSWVGRPLRRCAPAWPSGFHFGAPRPHPNNRRPRAAATQWLAGASPPCHRRPTAATWRWPGPLPLRRPHSLPCWYRSMRTRSAGVSRTRLQHPSFRSGHPLFTRLAPAVVGLTLGGDADVCAVAVVWTVRADAQPGRRGAVAAGV